MGKTGYSQAFPELRCVLLQVLETYLWRCRCHIACPCSCRFTLDNAIFSDAESAIICRSLMMQLAVRNRMKKLEKGTGLGVLNNSRHMKPTLG